MKKITLIVFLFSFMYIAESQEKRVYQTFYETGGLKTKGSAIGKKRIGEWKFYYENGQVEEVLVYDVLGKLSKMYRSYYQNGTLKVKTEQVNGVYLTREYYKSGILKFEKTLGDGSYKEFYETGELKAEADIKDGEFNGRWISLYKDGRNKWVVTYRNGIREGKYRGYYENGDIKLEGFAKDDKKNGEEINYYKGRIIKWKGSYENGLMVKTWIKYDENEREIETVKYKRGEVSGGTKSSFVPVPLASGIKERYPIYPGCEKEMGNEGLKSCFNDKLNEFIGKKVNKAIGGKLSGIGPQEIDVSFKINTYGRPSDIKVKADYQELMTQTEKFIKILPMVSPGTYEEKPVIVNIKTILKLTTY